MSTHMGLTESAFGELTIDEEELLGGVELDDDPNALDLELDFSDFDDQADYLPPQQSQSHLNNVEEVERHHPRIVIDKEGSNPPSCGVASSAPALTRAPKREVEHRFNLGPLHNALHAVTEDRMAELHGRSVLADNMTAMDVEEMRLNRIRRNTRPIVEIAPSPTDSGDRSHSSLGSNGRARSDRIINHRLANFGAESNGWREGEDDNVGGWRDARREDQVATAGRFGRDQSRDAIRFPREQYSAHTCGHCDEISDNRMIPRASQWGGNHRQRRFNNLHRLPAVHPNYEHVRRNVLAEAFNRDARNRQNFIPEEYHNGPLHDNCYCHYCTHNGQLPPQRHYTMSNEGHRYNDMPQRRHGNNHPAYDRRARYLHPPAEYFRTVRQHRGPRFNSPQNGDRRHGVHSNGRIRKPRRHNQMAF